MQIKSKRTKRKDKGWGGARVGAGRAGKPDPENWAQVCWFMRKDTIAALKAAAGSGNFGQFLQDHLDKFPIQGSVPSESEREEAIRRRLDREAARFAKLPPADQKMQKHIAKGIAKLFSRKAKRDQPRKTVPS
jgi:hypothetical protein